MKLWPRHKPQRRDMRLIVWAVPYSESLRDHAPAVFAAEHKPNGHVRATIADIFGTQTVLFDSEQVEAVHGDER